MKGIYIHIPFCVKKCNYCDFASYPQRLSNQDEYITALINEFKMHKGTKADTVYIGGGTPSVLSMENTKRLLEAVNLTFDLSAHTEFTVEVNPKTVDLPKAKLYKDMGVNRISIGSQSFCNDELITLGRIHTAEDIVATYELFREAGFNNISLDLMYALPGQTMESLGTSLKRLLNLNPEHISCYGLKIEEGTPFGNMLKNGNLKEADEDTFADMYDYIRNTLSENGYLHYEISNFAKEGRESRHNLKYWQNEDYLGFGLCASSKIGNRRFTHSDDFDEYISSYKLSEDYTMDKDEAMDEFVILALRVINSGVDKEKFNITFKADFDRVYARAIKETEAMCINTPNAYKIKKDKALVSNSIMCRFMR